MVDSTIRVAPPEEKLYLRAEQARQFGKAFDEDKERRVMGMPPVEGRAPISINADPRREKLTHQEDNAGLAELQAAAKAASDQDMRQQIALQSSELERLRRQVAELTGNPVSAPEPVAPISTPSPEPSAARDGSPDATWSRKQVLDWLSANEYPMPVKGGTFLSTTATLEYALAEIQKREAPGIASTVGSVDAAG